MKVCSGRAQWLVLLATALSSPVSLASECPLANEVVDAQFEVESVAAPAGTVARLSLATLTGKDGHLFVDVRSTAERRDAGLDSVRNLALIDLLGLIRRTDSPIAVIGTGYDEHRLADRIGHWPEAAGRVWVVEGGAAAWLLSGSASSHSALQAALAVPAGHVAPTLAQPDWMALVLDDASQSFAESLGIRYHRVAPAGSSTLAALEKWLIESQATGNFLMLDADGRQSPAKASQLSAKLQRPIFYAHEGARAAEHEVRRFADINRRPAGLDWGCQ